MHLKTIVMGLPKGIPPKIALVMKLTTFLMLLTILTVSAKTSAQKITLNEKHAQLTDVLAKIRQQAGYDILVDMDLIKDQKDINVKINNGSVDEALSQSLSGTKLSYQIADKTIIIKTKEPFLLDNIKAALSTIDVHGRVVDEKGQPLPGVTVKLKDESQVTTTDKDGNFILRKVNGKGVVVISFIGYLTKEINVISDLGVISLEISNSKLDEVQIIAYGSTSKRFLTSNIASIKAEDIAKQPVSDPLLALQGKVPGLFIEQSSGTPGANVGVTIQGKNSMLNGNQPFYVVDGVPYTPQDIGSPAMGGVFPGSGGSTLSFLNPGDIESIEFLKDADATAIYGSRAANGAILITTKHGKVGETKVDLNMQNGWGKITRKYDLLNTQQYLMIRNEAFKNGNSTPGDADYDVNGVWDQTRNTDWQKELIGGTALYQNLQASVSGGTEFTQFLIGSAYNRQTTVFPGDFSDVKGNVHFNLNHSSKNKKFQIGLSGNYLQAVNKLANGDITTQALQLAPDAPKLFNSDGTLNFEPSASIPGLYTFDNPLALLERTYTENTNNLISSTQLSYQLIDGLTIKTDFGYNRLESDETSISPLSSSKPSDRPRSTRTAIYSNKYIETWIVEPQLNYKKQLSIGNIDALVGGTFQQTKNFLYATQGIGYSNDAQLVNPQSAANTMVYGSLQSTYRYSAMFGRLNYRYKDKYILNASIRRDGSSRFGSENLFHSFYSLGGAWLFGDETWIKDALPVVSFGKLRVTYGTTGNDQIPDYQFLNLYNNYGVEIPYQNLVGLEPSRLQNAYLQWEETRKINLGLDLGFIDNRILLNVNFFRNRSSNQLLQYNLPIITGFNTIQRNLPATVQNQGWEFLINASPIKSKNFNWQASVNLTIPRNKLIRYDGLAESTDANTYVIGQPFNIGKAFIYAGVNPETGLYQFKNSKGELTSSPDYSTDQTALINLNPKFYGGLSNTFDYKGFELSFLFQFVKQMGPDYRFGSFPGSFNNYNQLASILNRWQSTGDKASIQKVSTNIGEIIDPSFAIGSSDAAYSDASYIRLKNASFSYTFPNEWLRKVNISNAKIFLNGQNLLTITKYQGDPEAKSFGGLPPLKVYALGLQLTF